MASCQHGATYRYHDKRFAKITLENVDANRYNHMSSIANVKIEAGIFETMELEHNIQLRSKHNVFKATIIHQKVH